MLCQYLIIETELVLLTYPRTFVITANGGVMQDICGLEQQRNTVQIVVLHAKLHALTNDRFRCEM